MHNLKQDRVITHNSSKSEHRNSNILKMQVKLHMPVETGLQHCQVAIGKEDKSA